MPNPVLDQLVDLNTAAAALGLKPVTLRAAVDRGALEARKVGGVWITTHDQVERYRRDHLGQRGRPKGS